MKFESSMSLEIVPIAAIAFAYDKDIVAKWAKVETIMKLILATHNELHTAIGRHAEQDKSKCFPLDFEVEVRK